jgi:hypothetical protein
MTMMALSQMGQGNQNRGTQANDDSRIEAKDREIEKLRNENHAAQAAQTTQVAAPGDAAATAQATPAGVTAPAGTGTPPPISTPGATVDFPLPDKSTVQVSSTIAEALQNQTTNPAIDAKAAYDGTAGASTSDHPWAAVNDANQMKSGDVLEWDHNGSKHYAMVVENANGKFVLDGNALVPFDPNAEPPLTEKYGNLTGRFHPTGLDGAGPDPASAAPPPAAVSQTLPTTPPPVTPPKQI